MNYLLIDIGNSRIKFSITANRKIVSPSFIEYRKESMQKAIAGILRKFKGRYCEIYVSSLDKKQNKYIKLAAKGIRVNFIGTDSRLPIKINYTNTLGSDRICSACGAAGKFPKRKNILVIDSGTALTFNIISNGIYEGGMIAAGLKTTAIALLERTTLPKINFRNKISLTNKSTKDSIISGLLYQQVLFAEKAIENYSKLYRNLYAVLTGGGSKITGKMIKGVNIIEPNLVLEGLNYIAIHNENIRKK